MRGPRLSASCQQSGPKNVILPANSVNKISQSLNTSEKFKLLALNTRFLLDGKIKNHQDFC
jgi:hypothetical protein